ncbi:MAG: toll/interleukin-1 receptor domain-containing protein [Leptospiraceae bacterium]|nr:toll/interleukin-1 receptor domain-containing protein [Leptospiraceae bacterium]
MSFLTFNELSGYNNFSKSILSEDHTLGGDAADNYDIFLSHSSIDTKYFRNLRNFFSQYGANAYIDRFDASLPNRTSAQTAHMLVNKISSYRKFIVLVTENSLNSNWVPWELGFAHGRKEHIDIALLPISEYSTEESWINYEYLGLYNKIVKRLNPQTNKSQWCLFDVKTQTYHYLWNWLVKPKKQLVIWE